MKITTIVVMLLLASFQNYAQVGIGTTTPDPSSILDIESTTSGLLPPRMTTAQRVAISTTASSKGLLVFDTDTNDFYFYNGASWVVLTSAGGGTSDTGWADYSDGTYTTTNPFILVGNTKYSLPNDAANVIDSQKPLDVTTFYDNISGTITGRNGDGLNIIIEFKIRPTTGAASKLTVAIDIGGTVGEIYVNDFTMSKGTGVEHYYLGNISGYTLGTWEANGGTVKIEVDNASEIYDIRYVITRTHKAR